MCILFSFSATSGQTTVDDGSPEVDTANSAAPSAKAGQANGPKADEAAKADDATKTDDADEAAGDEKPANDAAAVLEREFGVTAEIRDNPEEIARVRESTLQARDRFRTLAQGAREAAQADETVGQMLGKQVANENLGPRARTIILRDLAELRLRVASSLGQAGAADSLASRQETKLTLLDGLKKGVVAEVQESDSDATIERQLEAEREEEEAVAALERAKEREAAELDATLKKLAAREREVAEKALELTRQHNQRNEEISAATSVANEEFGKRKAAILEKMDELPADPSSKLSEKYADPALEAAVRQRRDVRPALYKALDQLSSARERLERVQNTAESAREALEKEQGRLAESEDSDLFRRRVAVARAELELAEKQLDNASVLHDAYGERVSTLEEHLGFYNGIIDELLPLVTEDARDDFFRIGDNENLQDARDGIRDGVRRIYEGALKRLDQALHHVNNLGNPELWTWIFALFLRLLLALGAFFFVPRWIPWVINRLCDLLMARRFFRHRPSIVIKLAEVLRGVARPLVFLGAIHYVLGAVIPTLPELMVVEWIVDAIYTYVVAIEILRIFVLPRWHRRQQQEASAGDFENIDETEAKAVADVFTFELTRGRKLVRSARVVAIFWLLSAYVPDFVREIVGTSIISNLVDFVATWGFVVIVYWVLSTWRNDIANLFDKVGQERLPNVITDFVQRRKDGVLGVLVIGLASIYVLGVEGVMLVRRYVIDTELFKYVSNFAFRKKIEYQAREREEGEEEDPADALLPPEFDALFEVGIALEQPYELMPTEEIEHTLEIFNIWKTKKSQGSIAFVGETGIGKTSLLMRIGNELDKSDDVAVPVITKRVNRKHNRRRDVLDLVAELFELEPLFETRDQLIRVLKEQDPRIVLLDDCHNVVFRRIGGFEALDTLLDIINLTDETHFYIITFNSFAWSYVNRVRPREAYFGSVNELGPWSESKIQQLIESRVAQTEYMVSFNELVITPETNEKADYLSEVVKTAAGYFRYLTEFCGGNPSVAMAYWLRSLRPLPGGDHEIGVSLFKRPADSVFSGMTDSHWFVLNAIAQHGALNSREVADVVNLDEGFCMLALNFFEEREIVERENHTGRVKLRPVYFRQVLRSLTKSNFLYS